MEVEEDDSVDYDLLDEDERKQEEERLIEERRKRRQAILDKYNKSSPGATSNVSTPTAQSKDFKEMNILMTLTMNFYRSLTPKYPYTFV
jgi:serine/threonine-protein kinase PRP4